MSDKRTLTVRIQAVKNIPVEFITHEPCVRLWTSSTRDDKKKSRKGHVTTGASNTNSTLFNDVFSLAVDNLSADFLFLEVLSEGMLATKSIGKVKLACVDMQNYRDAERSYRIYGDTGKESGELHLQLTMEHSAATTAYSSQYAAPAVNHYGSTTALNHSPSSQTIQAAGNASFSADVYDSHRLAGSGSQKHIGPAATVVASVTPEPLAPSPSIYGGATGAGFGSYDQYGSTYGAGVPNVSVPAISVPAHAPAPVPAPAPAPAPVASVPAAMYGAPAVQAPVATVPAVITPVTKTESPPHGLAATSYDAYGGASAPSAPSAPLQQQQTQYDAYGRPNVAQQPQQQPQYDTWGRPVAHAPQQQYDAYGRPVATVTAVTAPAVHQPQPQYDAYGRPLAAVQAVVPPAGQQQAAYYGQQQQQPAAAYGGGYGQPQQQQNPYAYAADPYAAPAAVNYGGGFGQQPQNVYAAAPAPATLYNNASASTLPPFWEEKFTPEGRPYYIDHQNRTTSWTRPYC